jgi:hypothetical protein
VSTHSEYFAFVVESPPTPRVSTSLSLSQPEISSSVSMCPTVRIKCVSKVSCVSEYTYNRNTFLFRIRGKKFIEFWVLCTIVLLWRIINRWVDFFKKNFFFAGKKATRFNHF